MAIPEHRKFPQWSPPGTALQGTLPVEREARVVALEARLRELARVSLAVIDADAVRECVLPESRVQISQDDFTYDIPQATAVKRALLRVERLSDLEPQVAIWRRRPDLEGKADLVLAGSDYTSQFSGWDMLTIPVPEAMARAFAGEPAAAHGEHYLSLFAPLRDSLDDVVAVLELCVQL